jgi:hypothetical protein
MKIFSAILLVVSLFLSDFSLVHAGEDGWLTATLRTDLTAVRTAKDYITFLEIVQYPNSNIQWQNQWWSKGYLKIYIPNTPPSVFMEVGIRLRKLYDPLVAPRKWYVDAPGPGLSIQCLRGTYIQFSSCVGDDNDSLTTTAAEYRFELVTYGDGFWIARVQNMSTLQIADVARISTSSTVANNVFVSMWLKEGSDPPPNKAIFRHRDPSYMVWGSGFQLWPLSSGGNNNTVAAVSLVGCPQYYKGASVGTRTWLAGNLAAGSCTINPLF